MALADIDYIVIIAYFLIVLAVGYLASRRKTKEGFLIAERKLGVFSSMATINASKTGSILMIFTALVYLYGFSAMWYFIGVVTGYIVFIFFADNLKNSSKGRYYTLADYFLHKYGRKAALLASLLTIIIMAGLGILNLIAGAKIFQIFGGLTFTLSALLIAGVILVYLLLGGFKSVVKTDILQYGIMVILVVFLAAILFGGVSIPAAEWNLTSAGPATIFGFLLIGIVFPFASPDLWQRVYAAKDVKTFRKGMILSIVIYIFVALMLALVALSVKTQLPGIDPDTALVSGFSLLLGPGLAGLAIVMLFSALMSTADTFFFTASSAVSQDFLKKHEPVSTLRYTLVIVMLVSTIITLLTENLVIAAYIFSAFFMVLAVPAIASWVKKSISPTTIAVGLGFGLLSTIALLLSLLLLAIPIEPALAVVVLGLSFVGLFIGSITNRVLNNLKK